MHNLKNQLKQHLNSRVLPRLERLLSADRDRPPIFIIGAPRSGSTLLFQLVTDYFDVGFLSNGHMRMWGAPGFYEYLTRASRKHHQSNYRSRLGQTQGEYAPNEGGPFFYRFFRRSPQYVPLDAVNPTQMENFTQAVGTFTAACERSIVFKNMHCALRLRPLAQALPNALFLVINRSLLDNSQSLLAARMKTYGNYETWWSMEPPSFETIKNLPAEEQVVRQILDIQRLIDEDKQAIGADRFLELHYETVTQNPAATMHQIEAFLNEHNTGIHLRDITLPNSFPRRKGSDIDPDLYKNLLAVVNEKS
ncbi:MAG: sulfotransferase [Pseudomonadales bacterium]|nr:sulfotransferase [Pseudomonadales bacterium]